MRATPTVVTYGNSSGHWGRLSPTNTGTVSFSAGSGYISNTKASGINFGQNAAGDTLLIGFGHITAPTLNYRSYYENRKCKMAHRLRR